MSHPTHCPNCQTKLIVAPAIGPYCPNKACPIADGPFDGSERVRFTYTPTPLEAARQQAAYEAEQIAEVIKSLTWGHISLQALRGNVEQLQQIKARLEALAGQSSPHAH